MDYNYPTTMYESISPNVYIAGRKMLFVFWGAILAYFFMMNSKNCNKPEIHRFWSKYFHTLLLDNCSSDLC